MKEKLDKTNRSLIPIWISLIPVYVYLAIILLLATLLRRDGSWLMNSDYHDPDELCYYNDGDEPGERRASKI